MRATGVAAMSSLLLPHVSRSRPVMLCCDLQTKFQPAIPEFHESVHVANRMLQLASQHPQDCAYIVTEHYTKGLGTIDDIKLADAPDGVVRVFDKTLFSMATEEVVAAMDAHVGAGSDATPAEKHAVLWGIEAHVCVLQTADDLVRHGWRVHLLVDGTHSQKTSDRKYALKTLDKMPGVTLTTSESVLFQLLRDTSDPRFKAASALLRQPKPEPFATPMCSP